MRRLFPISLLALLACSLAFVGCDSGDDDTPDPSQIVGDWAASSINVSIATPLGSFPVPVYETGDTGSVTLSFDEDAQFDFTVRGPIVVEVQGFDPVVIVPEGAATTTSGSYTLANDEESIDLTATSADGQPIPPSTSTVPFEYRGDDSFVLTIDNSAEGRELLAFLLGDAVPEELFDAIEGGEAQFDRSSN